MEILPGAMLSEEMQEILAVPDPDLDKFDPGNAVRRSTRAIKAPKPFAAVPLSPPANKRQKRQQEPKGLQSPPVTLANNTVQTAGTAKGYNSLKSQSKSEQRAQDDDGDVEMNDEDEMESDAGDEFNPENKKRPRASQGCRGLDMPVQVTVAADTNVEGVVSKNAPDIGPDALIEANLFAVLRGNTGVLAPEPIQSSTDGRTTGNTSSAQSVAAVPTGALATGLTTQRPNSDEEANLDAKLSVGLQPQRTDKERPLSQGEPLVWAEGRQALCESLPYFRGYQSAGYSYGGLVYGFLLDKECHSRDYMDATVVITRAGGGLSKDKTSGTMVQNEDQSEGAQIRAMRHNIERHVPIVLIVGKSNPKCPSTIPHTYCVMGWFKPTHIWSEMDGAKKLFKYRLEKMDMGEPSWWAAKTAEATMSTTNAPTTSLLATNSPALGTQTTQASPIGISETGTLESTDSSTPSTVAANLPAANYECCQSCHEVWPQVYFQGWMCLSARCDRFWELRDRTTPGLLTFDLRFLKQQTPWPAMNEPYGVKPDPVNINGQHWFGFDVSYAAWKGFVCPQCGRCNSRQDWKGWRCMNDKCNLVHDLPHVTIPARAVSDPNLPLTVGHAIPRDTVMSPIETKVEFFKQYRVHTYTIPDCGTIVHFMANKVINEEPGGPDEMWHDIQSADIGLKRRELQNAMLKGPMLTQHFAMNYGMPYKYAVAVESESFEDCCQSIRSARSRLNWAGRYVAGSSRQHQEFNELLALGYFEKQAIDFHDDGEFGLGPTIATLSLGYPATMKIRMKAKHYSGVSKGGVYLHADPPVPGSLQYAARLQSYMAMDGTEGSAARKIRGQAIKGALGLKSQNCPVLLSMQLNHGDIVVMHGEKIQKYYEHAVQPAGLLRFALTCRYIDPSSLPKCDAPNYDVDTDDGFYDGEHPVTTSIHTPPSTASTD